MGTFRTSDGIQIAYEDWDADPGPATGPPVVLHHGFLADGRLNWLYGGVVGAFTAAGRRVVAPDARGGGVGAGVVEVGGVETRAMDRKLLAQGLLADDPDSITDPMVRQFRQFADSIPGNDRRALAAQASSVHTAGVDLASIQAPTLLIVGRDDPLAARPEVLAGAIPGAELRVVEGDHLGALGDPAFIPSIVGFVSGSAEP